MRRLPFRKTFSRFRWEAVPVIDAIGGYVEGVWIEDAEVVHRTIQAIPLAMSSDDLKFYADGEASEAGITLTTADTLHFTDINAIEQTKTQSYIIYQGYKWRVVGNNLMLGNVDRLTIYAALRFIK